MSSGEDIGSYAQQFVGTPYVWGGNDLSGGVDCSGLIQQVYKHFGIDLPRTTYDMIGQGQAIDMKGLRPGDLMFFDTNPKIAGPDHVGIYLGEGRMIEAPKPGKGVQITDVTKGYYLDTFMGGRRISGVHSVGGSSADFGAGEKLTPQEMAASYGWAYGFMNSNSDIKGKFDQAVKEGWTPARFQAELRDTDWWKNTSDTRRNAQVAQKTDPATWEAQMDAATVQVKDLAAQIGAAIPPQRIKGIVKTMLETGADEGQMREALSQYVTFSKNGTLTGEAGMHEYTMKQYAASMGVTLGDQAIKNQAARVVRKVATTQDFESDVREQAKSMYPSYSDQIDAGQTVQDIASPYVQMAASELQLPDSNFTLNEPMIKKALNGLDAAGKPSGVSLADFQQQLRNDPRWSATDGAQDSALSTSRKVLKDMGLAT